MKQIRFFTTGILLLLLAASAPIYAKQQDQGKQQGQNKQQQRTQQQGQGKQQQPAAQQQQRTLQQGQGKQQPAQQPRTQQQGQNKQQRQPAQQRAQQPQQNQNRQQTSQPAPRKVGPPQQTYGGAYPGGVRPNNPIYGGVHGSGVPQRPTQVRNGFGQSRARSWDNDHRTWGQRGGYNGYRVPDDRFRQYFGSNHHFRIYGLPLVFVGGYPRFQYDGYWVTFMDPWPETWPATWYETDDVYVDYTDDGYYVYNRTRPGPRIAVTITF